MHWVLFLIRSTEKNKVKDKEGREEKWKKRIEGHNIIMDEWGKPDRHKH